MPRRIGREDQLVALLDGGLKALAGRARAARPSPAADLDDVPLSADDTAASIRLMRVNRAGEIAAQALYSGQAVLARSDATRTHLNRAAREEADHLAWCTERLEALGGRPSLLDPFWYVGSLGIGLAAGAAGDAVSLGFVAETEAQVEAHLADHLRRLPAADGSSHAILSRMAADEAHHGTMAQMAGGRPPPAPVRRLMACGGQILRQFALYL